MTTKGAINLTKQKEILIKTNKLCKTFSNEGVQQHVLKNLDIEIYKGDFTVIMGSSGAGKSTLLFALSGMDKPTLGDIFYKGTNLAGLSSDKLAVFRRANCGFVFQQIFLIDKMSVMDNVLLSGMLVSKNKAETVKTANELFDKVNIDKNERKKFPSQLSGGEQQRAAIVRGLINKPEILFADEPTGALNSQNSTAALDVLTDFNNEGQTIVMVTHDIKSALRGNRVVYLRDGIVCGECELGKFKEDDPQRRAKLEEFLKQLRW